ncbi:hypothetical protein RU639_005556 [Aspergillus parasiticus]
MTSFQAEVSGWLYGVCRLFVLISKKVLAQKIPSYIASDHPLGVDLIHSDGSRGVEARGGCNWLGLIPQSDTTYLIQLLDLEELPMALCCAFGCSSFTPNDSSPGVP